MTNLSSESVIENNYWWPDISLLKRDEVSSWGWQVFGGNDHICIVVPFIMFDISDDSMIWNNSIDLVMVYHILNNWIIVHKALATVEWETIGCPYSPGTDEGNMHGYLYIPHKYVLHIYIYIVELGVVGLPHSNNESFVFFGRLHWHEISVITTIVNLFLRERNRLASCYYISLDYKLCGQLCN